MHVATVGCSILQLPEEKRLEAAQQAIRIRPANAPSRQEPSERLALLTSRYWGQSGVALTVGFLDTPSVELRAKILLHMNAWGAMANVQFHETAGTAQVRIARTPGKGHYSYLGTDILLVQPDKPTMNLDSFSIDMPDSEFRRVVRHEAGHTLGFPHEHQRPEVVNRIDPVKAMSYFKQLNGWSDAEVVTQVLTPLASSALFATEPADPNSIMGYWLPASIMKDGIAFPGGIDIDAQDARFSAAVYPQQPLWLKLSDNPALEKMFASGGNLYAMLSSRPTMDIGAVGIQLHGGPIFRYVGPPISGWEQLSENPDNVAVAADDDNLYVLLRDGTLWKYVKPPISGWLKLADNPALISIAASGGNLYGMLSSGPIFRYTGPPISGWEELSDNPDNCAMAADGEHLYVLLRGGTLWKYVKPPISGWLKLADNPALTSLAASGGNLYGMLSSGPIFKYTGPPISGWEELSDNPDNCAMATDGEHLYVLLGGGTLWKHGGPFSSGWLKIDDNPALRQVVAAAGNLYCRLDDGTIWKYLRVL